jgi:hypothetical protein
VWQELAWDSWRQAAHIPDALLVYDKAKRLKRLGRMASLFGAALVIVVAISIQFKKIVS